LTLCVTVVVDPVAAQWPSWPSWPSFSDWSWPSWNFNYPSWMPSASGWSWPSWWPSWNTGASAPGTFEDWTKDLKVGGEGWANTGAFGPISTSPKPYGGDKDANTTLCYKATATDKSDAYLCCQGQGLDKLTWDPYLTYATYNWTLFECGNGKVRGCVEWSGVGFPAIACMANSPTRYKWASD